MGAVPRAKTHQVKLRLYGGLLPRLLVFGEPHKIFSLLLYTSSKTSFLNDIKPTRNKVTAGYEIALEVISFLNIKSRFG